MGGAQKGLPVVGDDGGAEEDEQGGEDGRCEEEGEDEGEEGGLEIACWLVLLVCSASGCLASR